MFLYNDLKNIRKFYLIHLPIFFTDKYYQIFIFITPFIFIIIHF